MQKVMSTDLHTISGKLTLGVNAIMRIPDGNNYKIIDQADIGQLSGIVSVDGTTKLGTGAGAALVAGSALSNSLYGENAGAALTTGDNNVVMGANALLVGTNTNVTVAIGEGALRSQTGASGRNTAVGRNAGEFVTIGDGNTMLGRDSGATLTTGTGNLCIGGATDVSSTGAASQFAIGFGVTCTADKSVVIGDGADHVRNDWGTDAVWDKVSDERMKNVLRTSTLGLNFISQLTPIVYTKKPVAEWPKEWDIDPQFSSVTDVAIHGMLAQDVKAALDNVGVDDFSGWKVDANTGQQRLAEAMFVYPIINAINELYDILKQNSLVPT